GWIQEDGLKLGTWAIWQVKSSSPNCSTVRLTSTFRCYFNAISFDFQKHSVTRRKTSCSPFVCTLVFSINYTQRTAKVAARFANWFSEMPLNLLKKLRGPLSSSRLTHRALMPRQMIVLSPEGKDQPNDLEHDDSEGWCKTVMNYTKGRIAELISDSD
ncbi:hypothetical protein H5410_021592, partial [Solanum commersonii]